MFCRDVLTVDPAAQEECVWEEKIPVTQCLASLACVLHQTDERVSLVLSEMVSGGSLSTKITIALH